MEKYTFKLIIIGDSHVGKSSLLMKYVDKNFNENLDTTIGVDFKIKHINLNNQLIDFHIWDTSGQCRFRSLTKLYYRYCYGVLIVFDLSDKQSFINIENWLKDINKYCDVPNIPKILIGNKLDLKSKIQVSDEEIHKFCSKNNLKYIKTSVKDDINIEKCFIELGEQIQKDRERINKIIYNIKNHIKLEDTYNKKKGFCGGKKC